MQSHLFNITLAMDSVWRRLEGRGRKGHGYAFWFSFCFHSRWYWISCERVFQQLVRGGPLVACGRGKGCGAPVSHPDSSIAQWRGDGEGGSGERHWAEKRYEGREEVDADLVGRREASVASFSSPLFIHLIRSICCNGRKRGWRMGSWKIGTLLIFNTKWNAWPLVVE